MMSVPGMILGTAAYMAPEQAAGQPVDKRADVWAFGVVLHEMLTGQRLFQGDSVAHILADVLRGPIDFDQLPKETPRRIRNLMKRCLDRDLKTRLRDIREARVAIDGAEDEPENNAPIVIPSRDGEGAQVSRVDRIAALGLLAACGPSLRAFPREAGRMGSPSSLPSPLPENGVSRIPPGVCSRWPPSDREAQYGPAKRSSFSALSIHRNCGRLPLRPEMSGLHSGPRTANWLASLPMESRGQWPGQRFRSSAGPLRCRQRSGRRLEPRRGHSLRHLRGAVIPCECRWRSLYTGDQTGTPGSSTSFPAFLPDGKHFFLRCREFRCL